jgi:hypothetical protein
VHLFIAATTDESQHSLRDVDLRGVPDCITRARSNKTIQIATLDAVAVETSNAPYTDMAKLLDHV